MSSRRKDKIRAILETRDSEALEKWVGEARAPLRLLFSLTYDSDVLIRLRAIEAIGRVAGIIAGSDMDKVRVFVRGLIWLMTEESGGIGWHAPEAIAEICVRVPAFHDEYAAMLPQFLDEEAFVPSTCAALCRLAPLPSELIGRLAPQLIALSEDQTEFQTYDPNSGGVVETTIGQLARKAAEAGGVQMREPQCAAATPLQGAATAAMGPEAVNGDSSSDHVVSR